MTGADLGLELDDDPLLDLPGVAAALAVHSGITSADAACCKALGQWARGQSGQEAVLPLRGAVWLFGSYAEQWDRVRADPAIILNAYNEVIRMETPVRGFARVTTTDTDVSGADPRRRAGAPALGLREPGRTAVRLPENFGVTRDNANSHVGFGRGVHGCAGQGLARLEGHAVLAALASRVERFTLANRCTR